AVSGCPEPVLTLPGSAVERGSRGYCLRKLILTRRYAIEHPVHKCTGRSIRIITYERQALSTGWNDRPFQLGRVVAAVPSEFSRNRVPIGERSSGNLDTHCGLPRTGVCGRRGAIAFGAGYQDDNAAPNEPPR